MEPCQAPCQVVVSIIITIFPMAYLAETSIYAFYFRIVVSMIITSPGPLEQTWWVNQWQNLEILRRYFGEFKLFNKVLEKRHWAKVNKFAIEALYPLENECEVIHWQNILILERGLGEFNLLKNIEEKTDTQQKLTKFDIDN